ncbi:hypothetical protein [Fischerella thermalis]|uniref:hypothetical protein n=1 Tax=Fischerella thermalis TaxID=372787 RepID=UPI0015E0F3B5|nr:hypothetical protein [Fischerella thermalis]
MTKFSNARDFIPDTDIANYWAIACSIFKSDPVHREQVDQSIASNSMLSVRKE